jgi:hypothetical protein
MSRDFIVKHYIREDGCLVIYQGSDAVVIYDRIDIEDLIEFLSTALQNLPSYPAKDGETL